MDVVSMGGLQIPIKRMTTALQMVVLNNCFSISSSIILSSSNSHLLKIISNLSIIIIRGMEAHNQGRWMFPTPRYNTSYSKVELTFDDQSITFCVLP